MLRAIGEDDDCQPDNELPFLPVEVLLPLVLLELATLGAAEAKRMEGFRIRCGLPLPLSVHCKSASGLMTNGVDGDISETGAVGIDAELEGAKAEVPPIWAPG